MPQSMLMPSRSMAIRAVPTAAVPVLLSAAFAGLALLVSLRWSVLMSFDREMVSQLNRVDRHSAPFVDVMRAVSAIASTAGWLIVLGSVALWLLARRR